MSIFTDYLNLQKKGLGSLLGSAGGAIQKVTNTANQSGFAQALRNAGGQLNPTHTFNVVPTAYAAELPPDVKGKLA